MTDWQRVALNCDLEMGKKLGVEKGMPIERVQKIL